MNMNAAKVYRDRIYENGGFPHLIQLIPAACARILDVGCGNGANLQLLAERGHQAVGLTLSHSEAEIVRKRGFECVVLDVTASESPFPQESFDAILFSHVLEHTPWPQQVLTDNIKLLRPGGFVAVALPNILQVKQRWNLLRGRFEYTETGLMDRTHLRFFDFNTARALVEAAGIEVVHHEGVGQCPLGPVRRLSPSLGRLVDRWTAATWPGLFAFHLIVAGRKRPTT